MPQSAISTGLVDLILPVAEDPGAILKIRRTDRGSRPPGRRGRADESDACSSCRRSSRNCGRGARPRLQPLQEIHDPAAHREADAAQLHRGLAEVSRTAPRASRGNPRAGGRLSDHGHQLLPRSGGVRTLEKARSFPGCSRARSPVTARGYGPSGVRHGRGSVLAGDAAGGAGRPAKRPAARGPGLRVGPARASLEEGPGRDLYPGDIETDVSPERLARTSSIKEGSGLRVRKELAGAPGGFRAAVTFWVTPPFSRVDLIAAATC